MQPLQPFLICLKNFGYFAKKIKALLKIRIDKECGGIMEI